VATFRQRVANLAIFLSGLADALLLGAAVRSPAQVWQSEHDPPAVPALERSRGLESCFRHAGQEYGGHLSLQRKRVCRRPVRWLLRPRSDLFAGSSMALIRPRVKQAS
jgi:hypothetical protein